MSKQTHEYSHCPYSVVVNDPKDITTCNIQPARPSPPLVIAALDLKTILSDGKLNEIIVSSIVCHECVEIDGPTPNVKAGYRSMTIIRKLDVNLILVAPEIAKEQNIQRVNDERSLLTVLLGKLKSLDPDIIIGHNFIGFDLDVLLHRCQALGIKQWSQLGRLKKTVMPKLQKGAGGMGDSDFAERSIMIGRIVVDTYIGAREFMTKEKSFGLTDLCLRIGEQRMELDQTNIPT